MNQSTPLRIVIIEDHDVVRRSLSLVMTRHNEFEVVGEAATAAEGIQKVDKLAPDVVVIGTYLPDRPAIGVSREIRARHPDIKVLMLTAHGDDRAVISSVLAGAVGYLLKEVRSQEIIDALRKAARGRSLLEPSLTRRVLERVQAGTEDDENSKLTTVEHQILELVAQGKSDREIASEVPLTESMVKDYITTLHGKLEVIRRTQSIAYSVTWRTRQRIG
jgi:DNA-binding NarL/FixJ family response regulator